MKIFGWSGKTWPQRALIVLTIVVLVLFASHPELRLLVPLIDVIGLDLFFFLFVAQLFESIRPAISVAHRHVLVPAAHLICDGVIFFLPIAGPFVETQVRGARMLGGGANGATAPDFNGCA